MRKHIITISIVLLFLMGLSIILYPSVSSRINARNQSRVISQYDAALAALDNEVNKRLMNEAREYNRLLRENANRYNLTAEDWARYFEMLDVTGSGIMGHIEIDKIAVRLPIYHGTDESVLQIGAGHLEWTSLPVGGPGTHSAITAHTGLPSAELFTKLDRLKLGDTFVIRILNEEFTYAVNQILVVEPSDISALNIETEGDYCTLITCTPYGINSHRLLVRGIRIPNVGGSWDFVSIENGFAALLMLLAILFIAYQYLKKKPN